MANYLLLAFAALATAYVANTYRQYARNLAAAKKSGFPYISMPMHTFNTFWLITHRLWLPILKFLPKSWLHPWIELVPPSKLTSSLQTGERESPACVV